MKDMDPAVDVFISKAKKWQAELELLRTIVLGCQLEEELKWGKPCYMYGKNNVAILVGFKDYCAIGFFKGALLKDGEGILTGPGENSQAMRQLRFTAPGQITAQEDLIRSFILEAVEVEKAGLNITFKKVEDYPVPEELQQRLGGDPVLKEAFYKLTPGRQRAYILHISDAKQSATRAARVEKWIPQILAGKGMNDR